MQEERIMTAMTDDLMQAPTARQHQQHDDATHSSALIQSKKAAARSTLQRPRATMTTATTMPLEATKMIWTVSVKKGPPIESIRSFSIIVLHRLLLPPCCRYPPNHDSHRSALAPATHLEMEACPNTFRASFTHTWGQFPWFKYTFNMRIVSQVQAVNW